MKRLKIDPVSHYRDRFKSENGRKKEKSAQKQSKNQL